MESPGGGGGGGGFQHSNSTEVQTTMNLTNISGSVSESSQASSSTKTKAAIKDTPRLFSGSKAGSRQLEETTASTRQYYSNSPIQRRMGLRTTNARRVNTIIAESHSKEEDINASPHHHELSTTVTVTTAAAAATGSATRRHHQLNVIRLQHMSSSLSSVDSRKQLCSSSGNNCNIDHSVDHAKSNNTAEESLSPNPNLIEPTSDIITGKQDEVEEEDEEALSAFDPSPTAKLLPQCESIAHRESTKSSSATPSSEEQQQEQQQQQGPRDTKRRKISQQKRTVLVSVVGNTTRSTSSEDVPADLWAWRKYGQKPIKGSPYPRGYYRCSSSKGCLARKQVERSHKDPSMLIVSYSAEHNHPWPSHRNSLAGSTRVTSASKLAKGHESTDSATDLKQQACTTKSAVIMSLEKQKSSSTLPVAQLKSESEEQHTAMAMCRDHSNIMEKELADFQEEKEIANGGPSEADEEISKADVVMSMPSYRVEQSLTAITTSGFSSSGCCTHDSGAGALNPPPSQQEEPGIVNVQVSSGQEQIAVQSYAESYDHADMLDSELYRSSSSMDQLEEDFFAELEELNVPGSSMAAAFGWGRQSFLEDQSDDEAVGSTTVVDPYNLFCWSTGNSYSSSMETKAVI